MTRPSPVRVEVFEENVSSKPILRVEITPTLPPHFDRRGRRATRQHSTTRAMSDEEILKLLQARERRRFAGVAEETANLMMGNFRVVTNEVLELLSQIDRLSSQMEWLEMRVNEPDWVGELWARMDHLEEELDELQGQFGPNDSMSLEDTLRALVEARRAGVLHLSMRIDELTDPDIEAIERVVNSALDPLRYERNQRELDAWRAVLSIAFEKGSDIARAVRRVVAAHENSDPSAAISLRDVAAVVDRDTRVPSHSRRSARGKRRPQSPRPD
jgi:hypothetical protein